MKSSNQILIETINEPLIALNETNINNTSMDMQLPSIESAGKKENPLKDKDQLNFNNSQNSDLSPDCEEGADNAPSDLLNDIIKVNFTETLLPLLVERKKFFRKLSVDAIMKWQSREIAQPLLKMPEKYKIVAVQMFRNLLGYMKDRKSSKEPIQHAVKFLKLTLHSDSILKDEAYVQVLKQLKDNKKYFSLESGWKFLAILSSCYVPSTNIYNLIMNFLFFEMQNNENINIKKYAKYIFVRMLKTKDAQRKHIPSRDEINCIENLKPIRIFIYFFTGAKREISIESYTTVRDVKKMMMKILDFAEHRYIYYSIYEICIKDQITEERFIEDNEKVCDVLSLSTKDKLRASKNNEHIEFQLYLKLLIFYPFDQHDYDTIGVLYYQTLYDVQSGKFKLSKEQIISLAALQTLNEFSNDYDSAYRYLHNNLNKYVPAVNSDNLSQEEWIQKIMELYTSISSYSRTDAMWNYLEELKHSSTYQTQQFDAKFDQNNETNDEKIPEDCVIGIKPNGIMILDKDRNEIVFFKYEVIMSWGISNEQFVIMIPNEENVVRRVIFNTSQQKVIQSLILIYCHTLTGKTLKELVQIIEQSDIKVEKVDTGKRRAASLYRKSTKFQHNELEDNINEVTSNNEISNNNIETGMTELIDRKINRESQKPLGELLV